MHNIMGDALFVLEIVVVVVVVVVVVSEQVEHVEPEQLAGQLHKKLAPAGRHVPPF